MSSLMDLGPLTEDVEIRNVKLTIRGLTSSDLFRLFSQVPDLNEILKQVGSPGVAMMVLAPDMVAKIIAIATGSPGDPAIEKKALELSIGDQMEIMSAVQRLSFPRGLGPFVEQLSKFTGTPMTNSPESSNGQATPSHEESNAALQTDSPGMMRGTSPRVN